MRLPRSLARSVIAAALIALALLLPLKTALASEYSDLWVAAGEDAWGVNFVQWDNIIFATFYIYGPDNKPVWYTSVLYFDGAGKFVGPLFSERGTYFGVPWNLGDMNEQIAGTATFVPSTSNNYQGSLTYTVIVGTTETTVNKPIHRLTVAATPLAGSYSGGESDAFSNCKNSADNKSTYLDFFTLQVAQSAGIVSLNFTYPFYDPKLTCTLTGTVTQNGLLYGIASATYLCSDGTNTNAVVTDVKATAQGIEGHFSATSVAGNCHEEARFSAARY
jgi:hypothetical protein